MRIEEETIEKNKNYKRKSMGTYLKGWEKMYRVEQLRFKEINKPRKNGFIEYLMLKYENKI